MKTLSLVLAVLALAGCGQQPIVVPVRNLERPSDVGFVCMAVANDQVTGRAMSQCHPPTSVDPCLDGNVPSVADPTCANHTTPRALGTFGLVPNTGRGDLSVIDMDNSRLVDLDPAQPGYNTLPLGSLPEVLVTTQDGCWAVTANRGSCDLTLIDPARLLRGTLQQKTPSTGMGPVAQQVLPRTASGRPLGAAPGEIAPMPIALRGATGMERFTGAEHPCRPEGGWPLEGDAPVSWRAIVSFPACDLVALMDLVTGKIVSSVQIKADGPVDAGAEPVCRAECGAPSPGDAAVSTPASLGVGPLALRPDGSRVYVGAARADFITALDVRDDRLVPAATGATIALHEQPGGVKRLRLNVDPWRGEDFVGKQAGEIQHKFLYAFAGDGSVRVLDVSNLSANGFHERECDTNVDVSRPEVAGMRTSTCFALPDVGPPPFPRRPMAQGPGLRVPPTPFQLNTNAPPLPQDIAFGSFGNAMMPGNAKDIIEGTFGFLLSSTGSIYAVNLDPGISPSYPTDQPPVVHAIRNAALGNTTAHVVGAPSRVFTVTDVPVPVRVPLGALEGPRVEAVLVPNPADNNTLVPDYLTFPSPATVPHEQVLIAWEDTLPGASRATARLRTPAGPTLAATLDDAGADFCSVGVRAGDVLLFSSCVQDADCTPRGQAVCQQAAPGAPGVCFASTVPRDQDRLRRCSRILGSRRRYDIVRATPTELQVALKINEVPRSTLDPCTADKDCQTSPAFMDYRCLQVRAGEGNRCVKTCAAKIADDRSCRNGTVCEDVPGSLVGALCVDAPPLFRDGDPTPDATCFPSDVSYKVQAGNSFLVTTSLLSSSSLAITPAPTIRTTREQGGVCTVDEMRNPQLLDRIPLSAPMCTGFASDAPASEARTHAPMAASGRGNPCLFKSPNGDDPTDTRPHTKALVETPDYRLVLTNLDQYGGDAVRTRFEIDGGFVPSVPTVPEDILMTMPVRIVTGPTKTIDSPSEQLPPAGGSYPYFYIVDQGRTATATGGRGQILRLDPRAGATGQISSGLSTSTRSRFQIQ